MEILVIVIVVLLVLWLLGGSSYLGGPRYAYGSPSVIGLILAVLLVFLVLRFLGVV